jgi:hypothetical protein
MKNLGRLISSPLLKVRPVFFRRRTAAIVKNLQNLTDD